MILSDLTQVGKDESKSCIFAFPDRPPDTLPPDYPPINPPDCYPYCSNDDWPNPVIPPIYPPGIVPPGTFPIVFPTAELKIAVSRSILYHVFPGREALLTAHAYPNLFLSVELQGDGIVLVPTTDLIFTPTNPIPGTPGPPVLTYIGAGEVVGDYLFLGDAENNLESQNKGYGGSITSGFPSPSSLINKLVALYPTVSLFQIKIVNRDSGTESGPPGGDPNIVNTTITINHRIDVDGFSTKIQNNTIGYNVPCIGFDVYIWYHKPSGRVFIDSVPHSVVGNTAPDIVTFIEDI